MAVSIVGLRRLLVFGCLNAVACAETALSTIRACQEVVNRGQEATKMFLIVALGVDLATNKNQFDATVSDIDSTLADLNSGNSDRGISAPPSDKIRSIVGNVSQDWAEYKAFLTSNVDTVTEASSSTLEGVASRNSAFLSLSEELVSKYVHWALFEDEATPSETVEHASAQLTRIHRMVQKVVLISVEVDVVASQKSLSDLERSFGATHNQLLAKDFTVCKIHQMSLISGAWDAMRNTLDSLRNSGSSSQLVITFQQQSVALQNAMESLMSLLVRDDGSCRLIEETTKEQWSALLSETSKQREATQRASRLFFQIVKGVDAAEEITRFKGSLENARESLAKCRKGSHSEGIPGPPTQEIADALRAADDIMDEFLRETSGVETVAFPKASLSRIAIHSDNLLNQMNTVSELYVRAALQAMPSLNSVVRELSGRQRTFLEKMAKEVILVVLDVDAEQNKEVMQQTIDAFSDAHWLLLEGRRAITDATHLFEVNDIPRTTDACTLNVMTSVLRKFADLEGLLGKISIGAFNSSEILLQISRMQAILELVSAEVTIASNFYKAGAGSCQPTLSIAEWEAVLDNARNIPTLFQESLTNYYLIVSKFSESWMTRAAVDLEAHKQYIGIESADPLLVDAVQDFTAAWNAYRETDEERSVALQAAYITLNDNPTGEKDKLDFAEGPEDYHTVHGQYHPKYRKTLYDRNYYDIFIFDTIGNLIYSVYKELDYATNFAANGTGDWKDSGLGEAFRAAMQHPDIISVIDWKPYGPSYGALASFLSTGVRDSAGKTIGVFCTQMPPESKPINATDGLIVAADSMHKVMMESTYGNSEQTIHPPPTPSVAKALFEVSDLWDSLTPITKPPDMAGAKDLALRDKIFMEASTAFLDAIVDAVWEHEPTLEGTKILIATNQLARLHTMCKIAVLLGMNGFSVTRANLRNAINEFEATHDLLNNGRVSRRLGSKTDVAPTVDQAIRSIMDDTYAKWGDLKPTLSTIADGGSASEPELRKVVEGTRDVVKSMSKAVEYFATTTRTTTRMVVEILAPVPLTGEWAGGQTMRTAAMVAEAQINADQRILPGFELKTVFFDDKCDGRASSDTVLTELSSKSTYIGLGGAGCSAVCSQTAYAASTMRLPFLSYECPAASLSDQDTYPDLTRFGTVTSPAVVAIKDLGAQHSWARITVVAADPLTHGAERDEMVSALRDQGFETDSTHATERSWQSIVDMMSQLKSRTKGRKRVFFVVGHETYFRKLLCASIVVGMRKGITWLSVGTWRDNWWSSSDSSTSFHTQWLQEDVGTRQLRRAFADFKQGWDEFSATDDERRIDLQRLYMTDEKDLLMSVEGTERYHEAHRQWHTVYRKTLIERQYYDIFFFDLDGNLIYSVYKETDYATNFALNGNGQWKDSGLGDAYRAARARPDNITYIDWKPYGPSAYADAAFLATGLRNDDGDLIGIYSIQLPPEYERSIEQLQEQCTLRKMEESFEGAINVAGLGRPTDKYMEKPLPCFKGHSAASFTSLLNRHLREGHPLGSKATQVPDPYHAVSGHSVDATCVLAFTVRHLLDEGYTMEQIQKPSDQIYRMFIDYIKTQIDFQGVSGRVKFDGNDRPNHLVVQQVQYGSKVEVGLIDLEGTLTWTAPVVNASWTAEFEDPPANFPFWTFQIFIPAALIACPAISGVVQGAKSRDAHDV